MLDDGIVMLTSANPAHVDKLMAAALKSLLRAAEKPYEGDALAADSFSDPGHVVDLGHDGGADDDDDEDDEGPSGDGPAGDYEYFTTVMDACEPLEGGGFRLLPVGLGRMRIH